MSKDSVTFSENLAMLRKVANLTQKQLADKIGIPLTTLAGYENAGRDPKIATVIKLADFFGVTADDLLRPAEADFEKGNVFPVPGQDSNEDWIYPAAIQVVQALRNAAKQTDNANKIVRVSYSLEPKPDSEKKT